MINIVLFYKNIQMNAVVL